MENGLILGVDPGSATGYASWDPVAKAFNRIATMRAWEAIWAVQQLHHSGGIRMVVIEDARLRTWFGSVDKRMKRGPGVREGAGAIKRECTLWMEMLGDLAIPHLSLKPQAGSTKWDAERFAKLTGWVGRTSSNARDAALLVWNRK